MQKTLGQGPAHLEHHVREQRVAPLGQAALGPAALLRDRGRRLERGPGRHLVRCACQQAAEPGGDLGGDQLARVLAAHQQQDLRGAAGTLTLSCSALASLCCRMPALV